jgi:hypothetical protein
MSAAERVENKVDGITLSSLRWNSGIVYPFAPARSPARKGARAACGRHVDRYIIVAAVGGAPGRVD